MQTLMNFFADGIADPQQGTEEPVLIYENFYLDKIYTPVNVAALDKLLRESQYDQEQTRYLVNGFKNGFSLGYEGREDVRITSENLKFTIGNETILCKKVI